MQDKQIKYSTPMLSYLSAEDISKIHHASISILEQTGSDCQYLLDLDTEEPKDFTFEEMQKAVRIAERLPHIDFIMSMGLAPELQNTIAFQQKYHAMLNNSTKPQVLISGPDMEVLEDIAAMGAAVAAIMEKIMQEEAGSWHLGLGAGSAQN